MINFYLPNFYETDFAFLNTYFITCLADNPEYFYDNIKIGALYGTFPGVVWNGGRTMLGDVGLQRVCNTISKYEELNIPLRFTYTNCMLKPEHFQDSYANVITKLAENGKNEILVNSSDLETFLRKNYPNYKYLSSTTKCLTNNEDIIKESDNYYLTVLDYRKNNDLDFLASLPNPEKYELLVNAYCDPQCSFREEHYKILSQAQINNQHEEYACNLHKTNFFEVIVSSSAAIKVQDLYTIYADMGFQHFKIEGRTDLLIDVLESYLYYMVKPQYKDLIRYGFFRQFFITFKSLFDFL